MAAGKAVEIREAIASLQRVAALFGERRKQLARGAGVSESQWQVLESVEGDDFMPSMFARTRSVTPAAVSRTLRQLQEADLLRASIAQGDGRQRSYRLTAKGRRKLEKLHASRARAIEDIWQEFEPAELRAFTRFANVLSERLEGYLG